MLILCFQILISKNCLKLYLFGPSLKKIYKWELQHLLCLYLFSVKPILIKIIKSIEIENDFDI